MASYCLCFEFCDRTAVVQDTIFKTSPGQYLHLDSADTFYCRFARLVGPSHNGVPLAANLYSDRSRMRDYRRVSIGNSDRNVVKTKTPSEGDEVMAWCRLFEEILDVKT